jgi:hypothetical protein
MVPDFRVFFPGMPRVETHSTMALLTFCLPVGMITYWVFQYWIKPPIVEVLPDGPYARWQPVSGTADIGSIKQWLLAACGILAGALSHLIWDAFTHDGGRGVRMFPVLDDTLLDLGNRHLQGMYVLQDLGSILGLAAVLAMVAYGFRRGLQPAIPNRLVASRERFAWLLTYALAGIVLTAVFHRWFAEAPTRSLFLRVSAVAVASLRGLAAALVIVSLSLDVRLRVLHQRSSGSER